MINVLNYILDSCTKEKSCLKVEKGEIFFSMDVYHIVFKLKDNIELQTKDDESLIHIDEVDVKNIGVSSIENIQIQYGSYLYYESGNEIIDEMGPYTFIANKLIAIMDNEFPSSVNDYHIGSYCVDDSCSMCDDVWEYGFTLDIDKTYWSNFDFFKYFDHVIIKLSNLPLPSYYLLDTSLHDDYVISILPSNTKNRRLGYLKLIVQMFGESTKQPAISFNTVFEKYVQPFSQDLLTYKNKKGIVVETKTGNSSKPYIELAESLGLIHKTAAYYELGKMGKVYLSIKQAMGILDDNPFQLDDFDKAFFFEQIMKKDYLYMYIIMELICKESSPSYKVLKLAFQKQLLHRLYCLLNQDSKVDSSRLLKLKIIEQRVKSWDKPMTYLEHILMPRINWLYDLGFIEYKNRSVFTFTPNGMKSFLNLAIWNDLEMKLIANPNSYINKYYMRTVDYVNVFNAKPYTSELKDTLVEYLNDCFVLFETIAPNRTTFSLAANYCKYMMLWHNRVIIDIADFENLLNSQLSKLYIFKYQAQYKDGYIQKR